MICEKRRSMDEESMVKKKCKSNKEEALLKDMIG